MYTCPTIIQDDFGETALVIAVNKGHLHVAEILVKNGADVNYRNKVRALIPGTQVYMYNVANDNIMVWYYGEPVQWDVQGMSNKHAACASNSRHACIVIPLMLIKDSLCILVITVGFCTYHVFGFPVRAIFASTS